jgi:hypothetical protein
MVLLRIVGAEPRRGFNVEDIGDGGETLLDGSDRPSMSPHLRNLRGLSGEELVRVANDGEHGAEQALDAALVDEPGMPRSAEVLLPLLLLLLLPPLVDDDDVRLSGRYLVDSLGGAFC